MNKIVPMLLALITLVFVAGCNQRSVKPKSGVDSTAPTKVYTEAELDKLIVVGMTLSEVTNMFGLPGSVVKDGDSRLFLDYMFRFDENRVGMSGFGVDFKDGHVVRWSPVIQGAGYALQSGVPQGALGERSFEVLLAIDNLTNLVNTIASQGSANATDLRGSHETSFKAKVFAGNSDEGRTGEYTIILVVSDQDASILKNFTENNVGKRLLIVYRNKVIAAPLISVPFASRQVKFTVKDANVLIDLIGK
jgi:hypothetical protein